MKQNLLTFSIVALLYTGCAPREKIIPIPQYPTLSDATVSNQYPQETTTSNNYPQSSESYPASSAQEEYYPNQEINQNRHEEYHQPEQNNEEVTSPATTVEEPHADKYHQMRTVRGSSLKIGETKTGFVFPQYQGKTVLLNIFGKECHFCLEEMPIIDRLHNKYQNNLQVVAIQAQDKMSRYEAEDIMGRFNMDYPIIEKEEAVDLLIFIQDTYGWHGSLPYMLLIKNGVTQFSFDGEVAEEELEENIQSLL